MTARFPAALGAVVIGALVLSGCASAPQNAASQELQEGIVAVAGASADSDFDLAIDRLDAVQARLDEAVDSDELPAAQAQAVQESIDLVRTDLDALSEPAEETEPVATPTPVVEPDATQAPVDPVDPDKPGKGNQKDNKPGKDKKNKP